MGKFDKKVSKKEPALAKKIKPKKNKDYVFNNYDRNLLKIIEI